MKSLLSKKEMTTLLEQLVNAPDKWVIIPKEVRDEVLKAGNKKYKKLGQFYLSAQWGKSNQYVVFREHLNFD